MKAAEFVVCLSNMAVDEMTLGKYASVNTSHQLIVVALNFFVVTTSTQHSGWKLLTEKGCFMSMTALFCSSEL